MKVHMFMYYLTDLKLKISDFSLIIVDRKPGLAVIMIFIIKSSRLKSTFFLFLYRQVLGQEAELSFLNKTVC